MTGTTKEIQYSPCIDLRERMGIARMGIVTNLVWHEDPRHLLFMLARYKFAAKMVAGSRTLLEIGCGDGFSTRLLRQAVPSVTAVDFDPVFIEDAASRQDSNWPITFRVHDILSGPVDGGPFDAVVSLDVMEHIDAKDEDLYLANVIAPLASDGILVIGMPSLESQAYASERSRAGHVNCKSGPDLAASLSRHFRHVLMFSMNDEVVHTGHHKMAHYIFAVCTGLTRAKCP